MCLRLILLTVIAAAIPAAGFCQGYTLRPGPRGFDPRLNPYGATENPAAAAEEDDFDPSRTTVKIELLQQADGGGLAAQEWSKTLADLGYPARIRRPILSDKDGVTETTRGPLRFVTVVGTLDRRGNLVFPGRTFSPGDAAKLGEWLDELKTYGAQGSPEGKPLWGLSQSQFEAIYAALSRRVTADVSGLPLEKAIAKLPLPAEYPIRFSVEAAKTAADEGRPVGVSRPVTGLTAGTVLAFALNDYGLGFRPERTPEGKIELLIEPLPPPAKPALGDDPPPLILWPVGWDIEEPSAPAGDEPVKEKEGVLPNRYQFAPELLQQREDLGFRDVPLLDLLATAEKQTGVPVLIDRPGIESSGFDLEKARVSTRPRNTSWNVILRSATLTHRLRHEVRRDEAGHPLVWVMPLRLGRSGR